MLVRILESIRLLGTWTPRVMEAPTQDANEAGSLSSLDPSSSGIQLKHPSGLGFGV